MVSGYGTVLNLCVTILSLFFLPVCEVGILCVVSFLGLVVGFFVCMCAF